MFSQKGKGFMWVQVAGVVVSARGLHSEGDHEGADEKK